MDIVKSQIETLTEDSQGNVNYISWKFKLNLTLRSKELYDVARGAVLKPDEPSNTPAVIAWVKKDLDAQTCIGLNVSSNIAKKIANCNSAHSMLLKLETLYGKRSDLSIEGLQRNFFSLKYDASKSVVENCMTIQQCAEDLAAEGETIKESWVMTRILGILPPKLHHFRTSWDNANPTDRNIDTLIERLRLEEDRLKEDEEKPVTKNALFSKRKKQGNSSQQSNSSVECFKCGQKGHVKKYCKNKPCQKYLEYCKKTYACNNCKQKGHFAKDCKNEKSDESSKNETTKGNQRALVTVALTSAEMSNVNSRQNRQDIWYQDSAATQHMTFRKEWLTNYVALEEYTKVILGDATEISGIGAGDVKLEVFDGKQWYLATLKDVLYVPKITFNLFSVTQMLDKGYILKTNADTSILETADSKEQVAVAERIEELYQMMFRRPTTEMCMMATSIKVWHEKLAHQNVKYCKDILDRNNVNYIDDWNDHTCIGCVYGKQHHAPHLRNHKVAENVLDLIHVDLGEMDTPSLGKAKYFLLFKDDFSHFRTVYFLRSKNEAAAALEKFMKMVENQFERKVKNLRSDNGTEIKNSTTKTLLEEFGVLHTKTNVYTPQQNGRIEREMRTIVESARSILHARKLGESLWAEAINYAVFTINQTGKSSVKDKSPAELWFGRMINISKLRSFGCECYVLIEDHKRKKMERKSRKGIFVGYDLDSPCYRVYLSDKKDVVCSDNVIFNETSERNCTNIETHMKKHSEEDTEESENESKIAVSSDEGGSSDYSQYDTVEDTDDEQIQPCANQRTLRDRQKLKKPDRYGNCAVSLVHKGKGNNVRFVMVGEIEDISVEEALEDKKWYEAMLEEYNALIRMNTWNLVKRPEHATPLTCRWVLRHKQDGKMRARLVVRGFEQREGIDFSETFSPVARHASIRLVLSLAASSKMKLATFDVKTAFLHGDLQETIYMNQPEGFSDGTDRVCKLNKSLYGLKQAPKNWNDKFSSFLQTIGLVNTDDDPCVYYNKDRSIILVLFVDDGLIAGKDKSNIFRILNSLNRNFEITFKKMLQDCITYLGMKIEVCSDGIFVSQPEYTEKILKRFKYDKANTVTTPMEQGMKANSEIFVNDRPLEKPSRYLEDIGSLLYLATISRPDINFAVSYLSRFNNRPMISHWKMVKRVFQYLRGTTNFGIFFDGNPELIVYTDSDYGGDTNSLHSTSGVLILRGGPIVWYSQKQRLVANSTAEAEYRAAVSSIDDICWIRRIGLELEILKNNDPTLLFIDNQSAVHMLKNAHEGKITKGKKHIEIPRKFIQQHIGTTVKLQHVKSTDQLADILTKPLNRMIFEKLRRNMIKEEC